MSVPALARFALVILALTAAEDASAGGSIPISRTGQVGPLQLGASTRSDVIAFAGKPESELTLRQPPRQGRDDLLGYGCTRRVVRHSDMQRCKTWFYVDVPTSTFEDFTTSDPRYSLPSGIRVGTKSGVAERILNERLYVGCLTALTVGSKSARVTIYFGGGVQHANDRLSRAHVSEFQIQDRRELSNPYWEC